MTDYAGFARFYDRIMGDRIPEIDRIRRYIATHRPGARSLLELGCGTGALLAGLAPHLSVTGIDRSPEMLSVAKRTVPTARLLQGDITTFSLPYQFDVVICMFDTLNHVLTADGWLPKLKQIIPSYGESLIADAALTRRIRADTAAVLHLENV